jgi:hypothetical protein
MGNDEKRKRYHGVFVGKEARGEVVKRKKPSEKTKRKSSAHAMQRGSCWSCSCCLCLGGKEERREGRAKREE